MPIIFENEGTIPLAAIKTFGVSAKDSDDSIGFFGTGLKYAIAIFLREGCEVTLFTDGKRIEFTTTYEEIRGKPFHIVTMEEYGNDDDIPQALPLGFTTELGKTWKMWMAFREMYCNTMDEHGTVRHADQRPPECFKPAPNRTVFVVTGREAELVWDERHDIILESRPAVEGPSANAHIGPGRHLYYRGIRVRDNRAPAMYDYNVHTHVELTEDRTLKYDFQARWAVCSLIMASEEPLFLRRVLEAPRGSYEYDLDFSEVNYTPGPTFLDVVGQLREECSMSLNRTAVEVHRSHHSKSVLPTESIQLSKVEEKQLEKAKAACEALGCDLGRYPVVVVEHLGEGVWGRAEALRIYLSRRSFSMGTKIVAGTLFEEYIHLAEKLPDESRAMQNWLIDRIMTLYEDMTEEPL